MKLQLIPMRLVVMVSMRMMVEGKRGQQGAQRLIGRERVLHRGWPYEVRHGEGVMSWILAVIDVGADQAFTADR